MPHAVHRSPHLEEYCKTRVSGIRFLGGLGNQKEAKMDVGQKRGLSYLNLLIFVDALLLW